MGRKIFPEDDPRFLRPREESIHVTLARARIAKARAEEAKKPRVVQEGWHDGFAEARAKYSTYQAAVEAVEADMAAAKLEAQQLKRRQQIIKQARDLLRRTGRYR